MFRLCVRLRPTPDGFDVIHPNRSGLGVSCGTDLKLRPKTWIAPLRVSRRPPASENSFLLRPAVSLGKAMMDSSLATLDGRTRHFASGGK